MREGCQKEWFERPVLECGDVFFVLDIQIIHTYFYKCGLYKRQYGLFERKCGLVEKIPQFSQKN